MWGNNSNRMNTQQNNGVSVNTRFKTFNSDVSSMALSLWNQSYSITISPAIGVDGNGVMQYDQNRQGKTALTIEACEALVEQFKTVIKPVYDRVVLNGEPCPELLSVTVETGREPKRNVVGFEMTPASDGGETPDLYFVYYGMVDSNNIASPASTFKHKFDKRAVMLDYNPNTGLSNKTIHANADFNSFLNMLTSNQLLLPYSEHVRKFHSERGKSFQSNGGSSYQNNSGSNQFANQTQGMNFATPQNSYSSGSGATGGFFDFPTPGQNDELPFS